MGKGLNKWVGKQTGETPPVHNPYGNNYYKVTAAHDVKAMGPSKPTNAYYGSAQLHQATTATAKAAPGDHIHDVAGGRYLVKKNGEVHALWKSNEEGRGAFERGSGPAIRIDESKTQLVNKPANSPNLYEAHQKTLKESPIYKGGSSKDSKGGASKDNSAYKAAADKAHQATSAAQFEGTGAKGWADSAAAHRVAASLATPGKERESHLAQAKAHQSLADEYNRDEQGRFAKK